MMWSLQRCVCKLISKPVFGMDDMIKKKWEKIALYLQLCNFKAFIKPYHSISNKQTKKSTVTWSFNKPFQRWSSSLIPPPEGMICGFASTESWTWWHAHQKSWHCTESLQCRRAVTALIRRLSHPKIFYFKHIVLLN